MGITKNHIDTVIKLAMEYGATKVLLFGSALDDPKNSNNLDIAVEGIKSSAFFLFGGILENLTNKKVDVVPLDLDSPFVRQIKNSGKNIYENPIVF